MLIAERIGLNSSILSTTGLWIFGLPYIALSSYKLLHDNCKYENNLSLEELSPSLKKVTP